MERGVSILNIAQIILATGDTAFDVNVISAPYPTAISTSINTASFQLCEDPISFVSVDL